MSHGDVFEKNIYRFARWTMQHFDLLGIIAPVLHWPQKFGLGLHMYGYRVLFFNILLVVGCASE